MNRIENKDAITDAAKLFHEKVRGSIADIPRKELCDRVDDVSKEDVHGASTSGPQGYGRHRQEEKTH